MAQSSSFSIGLQILVSSAKRAILVLGLMPEFYVINLPKTKKFGCMGRGDLTSLFFSKVVKY